MSYTISLMLPPPPPTDVKRIAVSLARDALSISLNNREIKNDMRDMVEDTFFSQLERDLTLMLKDLIFSTNQKVDDRQEISLLEKTLLFDENETQEEQTDLRINKNILAEKLNNVIINSATKLKAYMESTLGNDSTILSDGVIAIAKDFEEYVKSREDSLSKQGEESLKDVSPTAQHDREKQNDKTKSQHDEAEFKSDFNLSDADAAEFVLKVLENHLRFIDK